MRNGHTRTNPEFISYEHWIAYQTSKGLQIRARRFLPAYGVRFADHTAYTRILLDLDRNDQVYGLEVSGTIGRSLLQVMASPGKAEAILHDHGHRGFSTAGRWQFDVTPRAAIVGSAFYRDSTDLGSEVRYGGRCVRLRADGVASRPGRKWTRTCRRKHKAGTRGWC